MPNVDQITFQRSAVQPVECIKGGWELIKSQYWLFFGMSLVGLLIGSALPLGILMGPMMCGLYLAYFNTRRGLPIEFGTLFKGFDYFGQSVVAAILHALPIIVIVVPTYIMFYVGMFATMAATSGSDGAPGAALGFMVFFALVWIVIVVLILVISIGFTFAYPLIVDRGLQGFDAVKLSFRAAMANFWGLLGLMMLGALLGLAGFVACFVGVYLIFPITYAAAAVAYEQVFGLRHPSEPLTDLPPPPPRF